MGVQGVAANALSSQQQSLFSNQSGSSASGQSSSSDESAGSFQQQAKVSVLKSSLESKKENTLQLINSTRGVGQNVDTLA
jgi:hypothetical protein